MSSILTAATINTCMDAEAEYHIYELKSVIKRLQVTVKSLEEENRYIRNQLEHLIQLTMKSSSSGDKSGSSD